MSCFGRSLIIIVVLLSNLVLVGCTFPPRIYRIDIRQGNFITPEMIKQIKVGMSKSAVLNLMGTPALEHFFDKDRWDYYYYLKPGNGDPIQEKSVILYFKGQKLQKFTLSKS